MHDTSMHPLQDMEALMLVHRNGMWPHNFPFTFTTSDSLVCAMQGEAFFPHDYPDTLAYAQLAAEQAAEQNAYRSLRPKGRCPEGMPHPLRWDLLGACMTLTADSNRLRPLEAPASEERAIAAPAMSLDKGQPEKAASVAAEEAPHAVLDESRALAHVPLEEPAAMDVDSSAPCPDISGVQIHLADDGLRDSSAAASIYVVRSQRHQQKSQSQPGRQPSAQGSSTMRIAAVRQSEGTAAHDGTTEAGPKCLVRVALQTVGPGVLHEGAALLSLSAEEAVSIRRSMLGHKLRFKGAEPSCTSLVTITTDVWVQQSSRNVQACAPCPELIALSF